MKPVLKVDEQSRNALNAVLTGLTEKTKGAAMVEIKNTAIDILSDSQKKLKESDSLASGNLWNSGRIDSANDHVDVGYYAGYAEVIEFGRKIGSFPPLQPIRQWVRRKLRVPDSEADSVAYAVALSIKRNGTKAKPFLMPSFKGRLKGIENRILKAIKKATEK